MSERLHYFISGSRRTAVALPFDLESRVAEWNGLRNDMIRTTPEAFTRDEWAYLLTFLDPEQIRSAFTGAFGNPIDAAGPIDALARPRGLTALWLPNNVSLLGPLTLILFSLVGVPVRAKAASQAQDLAAAFLEFARAKLPAGDLRTYLTEQVKLEQFDRTDPRNAEMAATASVRVVFGSDDAVSGIDALPHPPASIGIAFSDHQSEAWMQAGRVNEETLRALIRVFTIYGQAGCTSPRRVVLIDGSPAQLKSLQEQLLAMWPKVVKRDVAMHEASANLMARQWSAALGGDAALADRAAAVLTVGSIDQPTPQGRLTLSLVAAPLARAASSLPENIQTIGHALDDPASPAWLQAIARTPVKRFVPLERMHFFGPVWDGYRFWQQLFEEVEVRQ